VSTHQSSAPRTAAPLEESVLAPLPGDLYGYEQVLPVEDQAVLLRLREWKSRKSRSTSTCRLGSSATGTRHGPLVRPLSRPRLHETRHETNCSKGMA